MNQYGNPSTEKRNEPRTRGQATNNNRARSSNNPNAKDLHVPCDDYLPEEQVLQDIAAKKTIRGFLRINPKQYMDAFITDPVSIELFQLRFRFIDISRMEEMIFTSIMFVIAIEHCIRMK